MPKRILCVHAHPDDAELFCGGTLALLAERGHEIIIATMTPGDCGSFDHLPEELATMRRREARNSAAKIGAEYHCAEFRDMCIFNDDPSRRRVTDLLRLIHPDVVLTASPADYHSDHEATSILVRDSCFCAAVPNYDAHSQHFPTPAALSYIPHLYFADPAGGADREGNVIAPHFYVNVASALKRKREMLACHESQRDWLKRRHGMDDYLETMERWTRSRGAQAGIELAEGFRQYKGHPWPETPLLEELIGAELIIRRNG